MSKIEFINPQSGNMRVEKADVLCDSEHSLKRKMEYKNL